MSENLNRSTADFSIYDSMSIGELEEILRADAMGPERDASDVDEILYVMEVLAKKRRENGIAGKTALEAYQEFQQHYLPMVEEESKPRRRPKIVYFRRIAAVAASFVLVFSLTTTANAFSFRDVWNAVVNWAEETFSFSMGVEISDSNTNSNLKYMSLQDLLDKYEINDATIPHSIPNGYELIDLVIDETPLQDVYVAIYSDGNNRFKISLKSFMDIEPERIEQSDELLEIYSYAGISFYIFSNYEQVRAAWIDNSYEYYISGSITVDELKMMIDSIEKG